MDEIKKRIEEIELAMQQPDFWTDKDKAQEQIKELGELKDAAEGVGKYDKGDAIITLFSGAGGDDAEDFSSILLGMYMKFADRKGFGFSILHENQNDHGGYRNITFQLSGKGVYGLLKKESGVHRLVRISPFNAKQLRHTSFSLVEVIPVFEKAKEFEIPEDEIKIEYTKSSGPGGQNVNKRETAVRIVHLSTNVSVHCDSERSQAQNKEKALAILSGKLYKLLEEQRIKMEEGMYVSKTTEIEWGSQIRSYVFHPYKMIKDHRTGYEERDIEKVLAGDIDGFINAEKDVK
jgi:peptide chain release factor 2